MNKRNPIFKKLKPTFFSSIAKKLKKKHIQNFIIPPFIFLFLRLNYPRFLRKSNEINNVITCPHLVINSRKKNFSISRHFSRLKSSQTSLPLNFDNWCRKGESMNFVTANFREGGGGVLLGALRGGGMLLVERSRCERGVQVWARTKSIAPSGCS